VKEPRLVEAHSGSDRKYHGVDVITHFRTDGGKKSKVRRVGGAPWLYGVYCSALSGVECPVTAAILFRCAVATII
jgi:hypothetical protein